MTIERNTEQEGEGMKEIYTRKEILRAIMDEKTQYQSMILRRMPSIAESDDQIKHDAQVALDSLDFFAMNFEED